MTGTPLCPQVFDHRDARFEPTFADLVAADSAGFGDHDRNMIALIVVADQSLKPCPSGSVS